MKHSVIDINNYCDRLKDTLLLEFGENLCYMGLQGSYLRGEETENSDIDIMIILDTLTLEAMDAYRAILEKMGHVEIACVLICSREDLKHWNPLEICHLSYTTKDLYGRLADFLPAWTEQDEVNYIKISLNNLYHALCHGYIHSSPEEMNRQLLSYYKSAFFILQNTYFLETYRSDKQNAEFVLTKAELIKRLRHDDQHILEVLLALTDDSPADHDKDFHDKDFRYDQQFRLLFHWCQDKMRQMAQPHP